MRLPDATEMHLRQMQMIHETLHLALHKLHQAPRSDLHLTTEWRHLSMMYVTGNGTADSWREQVQYNEKY